MANGLFSDLSSRYQQDPLRYRAWDSMLRLNLNLAPALWTRIDGAAVLKSMLECITPTNRVNLSALLACATTKRRAQIPSQSAYLLNQCIEEH